MNEVLHDLLPHSLDAWVVIGIVGAYIIGREIFDRWWTQRKR